VDGRAGLRRQGDTDLRRLEVLQPKLLVLQDEGGIREAGPAGQVGFVVQPKRWIIERTFV
jgi:hypothetical protein